MADTSKNAVTITVNHTGERCPIAQSYIVSPSSLAGCYRDAAAYFLDLAAGQLNRYGLASNGGIKEQAAQILYEHRNIFKEVTV